ncbi:hypothetical protein TNCV_3567751 [Trichonephila clavipes]|nr:hypothetical protein TNCV_3567751 [Trichonephila clavipes]
MARVPLVNHSCSIPRDCYPSGHGQKPMFDESWVPVLVTLKTHLIEWLKHVKSAIAQCPYIGVLWKFGGLDASLDVVLLT